MNKLVIWSRVLNGRTYALVNTERYNEDVDCFVTARAYAKVDGEWREFASAQTFNWNGPTRHSAESVLGTALMQEPGFKGSQVSQETREWLDEQVEPS